MKCNESQGKADTADTAVEGRGGQVHPTQWPCTPRRSLRHRRRVAMLWSRIWAAPQVGGRDEMSETYLKGQQRTSNRIRLVYAHKHGLSSCPTVLTSYIFLKVARLVFTLATPSQWPIAEQHRLTTATQSSDRVHRQLLSRPLPPSHHQQDRSNSDKGLAHNPKQR